MRVLVLGGGGREQALAWACRSHGHSVTVRADLGDASSADTDLVIPGPEASLVAGVADECAQRSLPCFGPNTDLAKLESSKSFARNLAESLGIPGPAFARFDDADAATAWWKDLDRPVVIKLDGLAGGKGVAVPTSKAATEKAIQAASEIGSFLVEERIHGPECSLLALCDGTNAIALPLAQDHKRIGEGDTGLNTGGMGAYAPAPVDYDAEDLLATFVSPIIDHLAHAGTPYIGVLYAGLMLTADGPRLIEYNVRFGDPEAQAVLPLLESDIAELALACTRGAILDTPLVVGSQSSVTIVAAAHGYPTEPALGAAITDAGDTDLNCADLNCADLNDAATSIRFDSGVDAGGRVAGGRVLAVTGLGTNLAEARESAYERLDQISFDGMYFRRDIGWRALGAQLASYADAGVDIDEGSRAVAEMKASVEATHDNGVLKGVGSFGGVFSAKAITELDDPVLVASTDGVGTKVELAARLGMVRGVGMDIVNHCIDDVLVQSARPLFFLDYIAASVLDADLVAEVVGGMAEACRVAGCALLGGETAEMPGVYHPGSFDIAGTLIGVAERSKLLPRSDVAAGDVLIGVASSGPHTNGYTMLRNIFNWIPMDVTPDGFDRPLGETLLEPHRSYLDVLDDALGSGLVKALAHITGGGLPENLPRVLPSDVDAIINLGSWPVPPLFKLVRELTPLMPIVELYRTVNMGIGMVVVCAPDDVDTVAADISEPTWVIGHLSEGSGEVRLR
jgi:phosphoribosylamine--glycine ligase/phosphoribosylaminoimidazole synthetase